MDVNDVEHLRVLEEGLWRQESRFDAGWLDGVLAPGFVEHGRSGRRWTRDEVLAMAPGPIQTVLPLPSYDVREVAGGVAVATYESLPAVADSPTLPSLRMSVWVRTDVGWRLAAHTGTPTG